MLAANYGGRWDIVNACQQIAKKVQLGEFNSESINDELFSSHLSLNDLPEVDFFIRTSGEERISNFFLWQVAYSELYFTKIYWPDFNEVALDEAILEYQSRERRYGKILEVEE